MRRIIWKAVAAGVILLGAALLRPGYAGSAWAELTPTQAKEATALVKQLGDADFSARETATKKLIEMGQAVAPMVKKAGEETTDAEVRSRCELVEKALAEQAELAKLEPAKVTLEAKDRPIKEVLAELAKSSGNQAIDAEGLGDRKVTVSLKDATYWEAVEAVTKSAGVSLTTKFTGQTMKVGLTPRTEKMVEVGTTAGPALLKLDSVQRNTYRNVFLRDSAALIVGDQMVISWMIFLETKVPILDSTFELRKATGPGGASRMPMGGVKVRTPGFFKANCDGPVLTMDTSFEERGASQPETLTVEGTLELTYLVSKNELKIENALDKGEKAAAGNGRALRLKSAEREGGNLKVAFDLDAPNEKLMMITPVPDPMFGLFLVGPDGKRYSGSLRQIETNGGEQSAHTEATMTFENIPEGDAGWSLIYVYPGKTVKKKYPFKVEGVPTP